MISLFASFSWRIHDNRWMEKKIKSQGTFWWQHTSLLLIRQWLNVLFCSLSVSTVQRSLQKTPFWRDRSHYHESARSKHFVLLFLCLCYYLFSRFKSCYMSLKITFQNSAFCVQYDDFVKPRCHLRYQVPWFDFDLMLILQDGVQFS